MSSYTQITGEIAIRPPLPWKAIQDSRLLPANYERQRSGCPDLLLHVVEKQVVLEAGVLTETSDTAVLANWRDETSGKSVLADLQQLIDENPGHEFTGYLMCNGEDPEDFWRVVIRDRKVRRIDPQITWPGESGA